METQNRLRRIDEIVMLGCALLILLTLGAIGETGRGRAKEAVCQANLQRWGDIFGGIVEENDGKFLSGVTDNGYWWPMQLSEELQDWKRNRLWFCPEATTPMQDESGRIERVSRASAWGIYQVSTMSYQGVTYSGNPNGFAGSLGLNAYVIPIPEDQGTYEGVPAADRWRDLRNVPSADSVPMFLDASRFDLWPLDRDPPAPTEMVPTGSNHMAKCCINRHDGAVNCLFVDGSVRKVGLKELWTLKWHRSFNTAGPWTTAGGVSASDWPQWMRSFKEY